MMENETYILYLMNIVRGTDMLIHKFVITRIVGGVIVVFLTLSVLFCVIHALPSDPTMVYISPRMSPEVKQDLIQRFALDKSLETQYIYYLKNFFQGDLGESFYFGENVWTILKDRTTPTVILLGCALLFAVFLDTLSNRKYAQKAVINHGAYLIPFTFLGLLVIFIFSFRMDLFPIGGWISQSAKSAPIADRIPDVLHHLVLPAGVLIIWLLIAYIPLVKTLSRGSVAEKKSLIPPGLTTLIMGSFLFYSLQTVMTIFSWPGYQGILTDASLNYDYALALGALLFGLIFCFVVTVCLEIFYGILTLISLRSPTASPS